MVGISLAALFYNTTQTAMVAFGCDGCLPAAWQEECSVDDKRAAEQQARKAWEDACVVWAWDDCPPGLTDKED